MTTNLDLTTWLLRQIDEDEREARRAQSAGDSDWKHSARWSPARVLADLRAKRLIISSIQSVSILEGTAVDMIRSEFDPILRYFAEPYADRPGYRRQWRP